MTARFQAAPWPRSLVALSLLGTIVLCGVGYAAYRAIPTPTGFTHAFGLAVALVPFALLLACLFFIVRGYSIRAGELSVQRLASSTRVSLGGLVRVWQDPGICKGSVRVFGNGGLFSFCGWFYNRRLGRYRAFATDLRKAVVLQCEDKVFIVTPAAASAFIEDLRKLHPSVLVGRPEHGR